MSADKACFRCHSDRATTQLKPRSYICISCEKQLIREREELLYDLFSLPDEPTLESEVKLTRAQVIEILQQLAEQQDGVSRAALVYAAQMLLEHFHNALDQIAYENVPSIMLKDA
ncbi:MAG: hypothetical protein AB1489_24935 [Acidobacteriota bacterium]